MGDDRQPCGAHKLGDAIRGSYFDYTCDDCMLPYPHLDPPELNDLQLEKEYYDNGRQGEKNDIHRPF